MDSSISGKYEIWFLRVCYHVPHELYIREWLVRAVYNLDMNSRPQPAKIASTNTSSLDASLQYITSPRLNLFEWNAPPDLGVNLHAFLAVTMELQIARDQIT